MMKHFVKTSVATAVVLGTALAASGVFASVAGSIVNTRHNMGSQGQGPNTAAPENTAEICIFCHTPHGGSTEDAAGNRVSVPLWNKQLAADVTVFSTYDQLGTSTLDAAVGEVGSVSLACLSCHDGTQAIDNIINAPGSGGYDGAGGGVDGLGWAWNSGDNTLDGTGRFIDSVDTDGTNIWAIGTDLTNDHPISVQYGGGGYSATSPTGGHFAGTLSGVTRDQDFAPALQIGGGARWYVDNLLVNAPGESAANIFDKWDFKLYTRDTTGMRASENGALFAEQDEPFVECGSCHDPHFQTTTFLRMDGATDLGGTNPTPAGADQSNAGSRVCLVCHTK
ncbi:MAG: hypothetical protein L3K25_10475 [Gammaproteobacteria bacterium]|nr:hypothetical protein [Gammaproteobacteria bacterium]